MMWVTRSAQTHRTVPSSTSATWNRVGTFASLAPPSTWRTSAIHQSSESLQPQMTVIPALTLRNTGAGAVETNLKWSSDIALEISAPVLVAASGRGQAIKRAATAAMSAWSIQRWYVRWCTAMSWPMHFAAIDVDGNLLIDRIAHAWRRSYSWIVGCCRRNHPAHRSQ